MAEETQKQADARIAEANAEAANARKEAAQALEAAAVADQKAAEARTAAAVADEKAALARAEAAAAEQRAAEANARASLADQKAAEANSGVTRLRTPRTLDAGQSRSITNAVKRFPGTKFVAAVQASDVDAVMLAPAIEGALKAADWHQIDWNKGDAFGRPGSYQIGMVTASGIVILYSPDKSSRFYGAAVALAAALGRAGIQAVAQSSRDMGGTSEDALFVIVGSKPL